jgi:hypothetical protein
MPIILATWKTEIGRIVVQSQPGQIVHKTSSQLVISYACHLNDGGRHKITGLWSRLAWAKCELLSPKYQEHKGLEAWVK